jgi:hypothetical protein
LLVEECHVGHEVLDNVHVRQGIDARFLGRVCRDSACGESQSLKLQLSIAGNHTKTSQRIYSIYVHSAAPADTLAATPPKCQGWVDLVLDPDQGVQHHRPRLVQVERVALHPRLRCGLVGVPPVDVECLDLGVLLRLWLLDCRGLALGNRLPGCIGYDFLSHLRNWVACVCVVYRGEAAGDDCGPYG